MTLELSAMRWLWLEQKCLVVLEQRSPLYGMGLPDVVGVTPGRHLTEIEIKRSVRDFKADANKTHRAKRDLLLQHQPRLFYYLAPKAVAEKIQPLLPPWAGLMTTKECGLVEVVVRSPVNEASPKLNLRQCTRLSRMMTSHMMGYASRAVANSERWANNDDTFYVDWVKPEAGTYEI